MKEYFRITKRIDFIRASRSGFYLPSSIVVVQCGFNGLGIFRVGVTASKRVGNAVVRNRCKRRMREAARLVLSDIGLSGVDYVFIARKSTFNASWNGFVKETSSIIMALNDRIRGCKKHCSY